MNEILHTVLKSARWIDLLDILIVSFIVYRTLLLIRGTRAVQMLTGLGILSVGYYLSIRLELYTLHRFLDYFFQSLILMVIVLFQDDLRRVLTFVGKNPFFSASHEEEEREVIDEISKAGIQLAKARIGALIVIERETGLKNFIDTGSKIDARVRCELLDSIFRTTSPLHDGAVIISNARIAAAGCFLPLSKNPNIDKKMGTRHRAAIGLSEETDAIIILISEEAGSVHLVRNGRISHPLNEEELKSSLSVLLELYDANRLKKSNVEVELAE